MVFLIFQKDGVTDMSVYIKGMEKPTKCGECPCFNGEYYYCQAADIEDAYYSEAPADCPLLPVPDHGRLIDADKLVDTHFSKEYLQKAMTANKDEMGVALINIPLVINNAPTIIPSADVRPVVRGKWIARHKWDWIVCSECSYESNKASNFCPNCGADMRGTDDAS